MEQIIQHTVVLLILSLITEKLANFIKLQNENIAIKNDTINEKTREKKIQNLSIIIGIIVALIAKANLFHFFNKNFELFWTIDDFKLPKIISNILGSIVSGLFLSLGSKFFHDLLDIVLQIKNLKRKLNDKAEWDFNKIEEVDDYLNEIENERVENELLSFRENVSKIDNVISSTVEFINNEAVVNVYVNSKFNSDNLIPKKIHYMGLKKPKTAAVNVIKGFKPITHGLINPTDKISNLSNTKNEGAMGGRVFDRITNEEYFISCFHVVKTDNHSWNAKKPTKNKNVINISSNNSNCGIILKTIRDDEVDVAVMKPINDFKINAAIKGIGIPYFSRTISYSDKNNKTRVVMFGTVSGYREGIVIDNSTEIEIYYDDKTKNLFKNLITIKAESHPTFSIQGDSGSFVLDEDNYLIGMIVGGYKDISYAIPIETILKKTETKLLKN